jgi:hypothetical protein
VLASTDFAVGARDGLLLSNRIGAVLQAGRLTATAATTTTQS